MPDIHIIREHDLGLAQARKLAFRWAETAEEKLDMECTYEEGKTSDLVCFKRPGASGELRVTKNRFELDARLGLLERARGLGGEGVGHGGRAVEYPFGSPGGSRRRRQLVSPRRGTMRRGRRSR